MSGTRGTGPGAEFAQKIALLIQERGWNQEDFARIANLNRHTVRQIMNGGPKRQLRNATVSSCADALGLSVNELRTLPLEKLLPRMHGRPAANDEALKMLTDRATLPELVGWIERNADRVALFQPDEVTELLAMQDPGGALEQLGVEQCVETIERRRQLLCHVRTIAGTEYLPFLEQVVQLVLDKVNRKPRPLPTPR